LKIEQFKSGTWKKQFQYRSFSPAFINQNWGWDDGRISVLLEQATRALGELNAFSLIVPDVDLFLAMHVVKEASMSSRIEGTKTEIDEALMPEEDIAPERRDDWREVRNYIEAMNSAVAELERLPVSNRLLCQTHAILMRGVRGETKTPGEIRRSQNWIGGSGPMDAAFVPPHHDEVPELMSDLEKFLHNDEIFVPDLVRVAIAHYQFETIHPFNDGNGRIGRLLIPLYLISRKVLQKPSLYLSDYFERNRSHYNDGLMRVRTTSDLNQWVRFFLGGVLETASKGRETFQAILRLRQEAETRALAQGKRAQTASATLNFMFRHPVLAAKDIVQDIGVSQPTADAAIQAFVNEGFLTEITGLKRRRLFAFQPYLKLFSK
jgi:Fic family protein